MCYLLKGSGLSLPIEANIGLKAVIQRAENLLPIFPNITIFKEENGKLVPCEEQVRNLKSNKQCTRHEFVVAKREKMTMLN